ncbi:MAG: amidohydrolase family protein [Pseudomonadota bacterium]|nr:amidohydrolase family protein [Pseudomonadota bacterium]
MGYDIKITGGDIIDGSGNPRYRGDVGIRDGNVVALGKAEEGAKITLDANNRVVSPGFIDIHTHYDAQIIWDPKLSVSPWHGITTVVLGNCGFGIAPTHPEHRPIILRTLEKVEGMNLDALETGLAQWPFKTFPEYMDTIEKRGTLINVGVLIGHSPTRLYVMGESSMERPATGTEVGEMKKIVREAICSGALGLSTSQATSHVGFEGRPVPSRMAEISEIRSLAETLGEAGGRTLQIIVNQSPWYKEFVKLSKLCRGNLTWTALLTGRTPPNDHRSVLKRFEELVNEGHHLFPQVACRPLQHDLSFSSPYDFERRLPLFNQVSGTNHKTKKEIYANHDFRNEFRKLMTHGGSGEPEIIFLQQAFEQISIQSCKQEPSLEGRKLSDIAKERKLHPVDLALDLAIETNLEILFLMPLANNDEDQVEEVLKDPNTVLALSDAGAHMSQLCDACYSTTLLGHWVREKAALTLEAAVHMLTSRPAQVMGITDRGRLEEGLAADLVIFDPARVGTTSPKRVYDLPGGADRLIVHELGVDAVIVNGTLVRQNGKDVVKRNKNLPGRLLRNGKAA